MGAGPGGERAPPPRRGQVSWSPAWAGVGPRGAAGFWLWPGPRVWLVPVQPRWLRFTHRFGRAGLGFPVPQVLSLQRGPGQSGSGSGPARKCRLHGLPGARLCPPHRRSGVCGSAVTSAARAAVMRGPHGTVERAPPQRLGLAGRPRVSLLPRPWRPPPWPATWVPPILTRHPREARGIQGVETGLSRTAPSTCRWLCLLGTLPAPRSRSAAAAPRWHRPSVREVSCSARGRTSSAARRASECHPIGPMGKLRRRE